MRKHGLRLIVALSTLSFSLITAGFLNHLRDQKRRIEVTPCPSLVAPTPTPSATPDVSNFSSTADDEFPEDSDLEPYTIKWFIDAHPSAKLERLWQRLGIKPTDYYWAFDKCENCKAELVEYNLDHDPDSEIVLKLASTFYESYRFIVFKREEKTAHWKMLGSIDASGKYREAQYLVLMSNEKPWLVISGQTSSGSGISSFDTRLFDVTNRGLREVIAFTSDGFQAGWGFNFTKSFEGHILSCKTQNGLTRIKIEFNVDYSFWSDSDVDVPLFSKRQIAVFLKSTHGKAVLDKQHSTLNEYELDHIYNIDSMTESDFLKYNQSELLKLATRGNAAQKKWLRTYLKECDNSSEKRQLLAALAN